MCLYFLKYTQTVDSCLHTCTQPQPSMGFTFIGWCTGRTGTMKCGRHRTQITWKPWQCEPRLYWDLLSGLQESLPGVFLILTPVSGAVWQMTWQWSHSRSLGSTSQKEPWLPAPVNLPLDQLCVVCCATDPLRGWGQIGEQLTVSVWFNTALPGLFH